MKTTLHEFANSANEILRGIKVSGEQLNENVVLMLGGFERGGTIERKFKILADNLFLKGMDSFRFDGRDCGLSDGDFYNLTTETMADDLLSAYSFVKSLGYKKISFVGHSLAACAVAVLLDEVKFDKIVLIAPALNQKEILRLWFAQKNNKDILVNWKNYREYYDEDDFLENVKLDLCAKSHKLNFKYRFENKDKDYSFNFSNFPQESLLLVHGMADDKVPFESLNINFQNKIIIEKGDHDLEKPGIIDQWLEKTTDFLVK